MWKSATVPMRRVEPSHKLWIPHVYQKKGTDFLIENGSAALFADPGTGKTSIVLNAFSELLGMGVAKKMLVIAPRRVCQLVWSQEASEWSQFRHLKFAWLHNSRAPWDIGGKIRNKEAEIETEADIHLINPEGVAWLYKKFYDHKRKRFIKPMPWDTVTVDELTKFKNSTRNRSKYLRKLVDKTPRLWGLTGSPTPNGMEDLFGQMLLLDGGVALGQWYTNFRDKYFEADGFTGFKYKLKKGADKRIEAKIAPLVLRIDADDWLKMPKLIDDPIIIKLDTKSRAKYDKLKKEMLLQEEEGNVTAANAAALYSKLAQLANGAVYLEQEFGKKREVLHVHDAKIEALDDLVDQLQGAPLLLGYEFNHDLARLQEWHLKRFKTELPYLGKGTTDREVSRIEREWNNNNIQVLAAHPASAGHGLNFQKGNACHLCWFSATWDFELYDQFIRRVRRQGNESMTIMNHLLLVEDSIDILKYEALLGKDMSQASFLQAINTAFTGHITPATGVAVANNEMETEDMALRKLGTKGAAEAPAPAAAEQPAPAAAAPARKLPAGWGAPTAAAAAPAEQEQQDLQRDAIAAKLAGETVAPAEPVSNDAAAAFSPDVQAAMGGQAAAAPAPAAEKKKPAARKKAAPAKQEVERATLERSVSVNIDFKDGEPVPQVFGRVHGDFDEDEAIRMAELVIAVTTRILDELGE